MNRNKLLTLFLVIPLLFVAGCVSGGNKKPKVVVDRYNNIPSDIPAQFLERYERFISDKERKEFKKLLTDEERQVFIDKFWLTRDPNPATPENEEKQRIDQLIDNIAGEPFFSAPGANGLLFRSNGGFRGDMAKVYLLHGEPDIMDTLEGNSFVPLMLWIYINSENDNIRYAFLFYQKGSLGSFSLFPQGSHQLDPCGAIYEVAVLRMYAYNGGGMRDCPDDLNRIYNEIYHSSGRGGFLDGYLFVWALYNFSQDSSSLQGAALEPPKPASEVAKQSNARVAGEAFEFLGTAGIDYILASCKECNSFIPAELRLGKGFTLLVRRGDIDWQALDGKFKSTLKVKIIIESTTNQISPIFFDRWMTLVSSRDLIISGSAGQRAISLLTTEEIAQIPAGTYQVNIYIKNIVTKKYNAWSVEFKK